MYAYAAGSPGTFGIISRSAAQQIEDAIAAMKGEDTTAPTPAAPTPTVPSQDIVTAPTPPPAPTGDVAAPTAPTVTAPPAPTTTVSTPEGGWAAVISTAELETLYSPHTTPRTTPRTVPRRRPPPKRMPGTIVSAPPGQARKLLGPILIGAAIIVAAVVLKR